MTLSLQLPWVGEKEGAPVLTLSLPLTWRVDSFETGHWREDPFSSKVSSVLGILVQLVRTLSRRKP